MSMSIGRHYIIRRDITTKLYIVHYGYVIEVIDKYCDNTSKTELDTAGKKCFKQRCIYMQIYCFFINCMPMGMYRLALHNWESYYYEIVHTALWICR